MDIKCNREGDTLTVNVIGRVDTSTAPDFEKFINENIGDATNLVLDLNEMSYTSSAGLRVLLKTQKMMNQRGSMKLIGVQDTVMEILEITGFSDILTIE
ncbi:MAG: STAS domain-containing protein [Eubacterium sp.]|nr:STAS domain-containing protein [Eubacterium sp.]MBQ8980827.1 STAS domain-containing protein [Eubacterium sp.]MBR1532467.1 STAS domain-containing protein [Eubacterium sp.]MBR2278334.1 STAS domain-containing protein [Eubacterium sp.]